MEAWHTFVIEKLGVSGSESDQAKLYVILFFCLVSKNLYQVLSSVFYTLSSGKLGYISSKDCLYLFDILSKMDYRVEKSSVDIVKELCDQGAEVLFDDVVGRLGITNR